MRETIGIIGAMDEEVELLLQGMKQRGDGETDRHYLSLLVNGLASRSLYASQA